MSVLNDKLLFEIGDLLSTHYEELQPQPANMQAAAFGRYLRATRQGREITIAELAVQSGVPESEILAYEHGIIPQTSIHASSIHRLAHTLGENLDNFTLLLGIPLKTPPATPHQAAGTSRPGHRLWMKLAHLGNIPLRVPKFYLISSTLVFALLLIGLIIPGALVTGPNIATQPGSSTAHASLTNIRGANLSEQGEVRLDTSWVRTDISPAEQTNQSPAQLFSSSAIDSKSALALINFVTGMHYIVQNVSSAIVTPPTPSVPETNVSVSVSATQQTTLQVLEILTHTIAAGENLSCIASRYYGKPDYYPILCLDNFGDLQCSMPLRTGGVLTIPRFVDLDQVKQQALTDWFPDLVSNFKAMTWATLTQNQGERRRGVDYFCEDDDYQKFGEQLVLAGEIDSARIPRKSEAKG